tara:strand:- start:66 stop:350 length:285 start_codon:yes stop_codon:yes gene_type:complete
MEMIVYEVRYDECDGTDVEWFRNKAQAAKRKRELEERLRELNDMMTTDTMMRGAHYGREPGDSMWVEDIVRHEIPDSKDGVIRFLNRRANRDNS